jgi:hypothetical protein
MGQNGGKQNRLFYSFDLEDHVPAGHLLRGIDKFLDLTDLHAYVAPFYSHTGRDAWYPSQIAADPSTSDHRPRRSSQRRFTNCEPLKRHDQL